MLYMWYAVKSKLLISISVLGLSFGSTILFFLINSIEEDSHFDRHHYAYEQVFRLETVFNLPGGDVVKSARAPFLAGYELKKYFSEIEDVTTFGRVGVEVETTDGFEKGSLYLVEDNLFSILNLSDTQKIKNIQPGEAVISIEFGQKIFPGINPIGKRINLGSDRYLQVINVIDLHKHTHLNLDILTTQKGEWERYIENLNQNWYETSGYTYVKLKPNVSSALLEGRFDKFIEAVIPEIDGAPFKAIDFFKFSLRRVDRIHYDIGLSDDIYTTIAKNTYNFLIVSVLFVLLVVAMNFFSLMSVLDYQKRNEHVVKILNGAKKVDLLKEQLVRYFVISIFVMFFSLLFCKMLEIQYEYISTWFGGFGDKVFKGSIVYTVIYCISVPIFSGLITFVTMSKKKNLGIAISRYGSLPSPLFGKFSILIQTVFSVFLIVLGAGAYHQLDGVKSDDYGYDSNSVNYLSIPKKMAMDTGLLEALKDRIFFRANVDDVSLSSWIPFDQNRRVVEAEHSNRKGGLEKVISNVISSDRRFFNVWKIPIRYHCCPVNFHINAI